LKLILYLLFVNIIIFSTLVEARKKEDPSKKMLEKVISAYDWGSYSKAANLAFELNQKTPTNFSAFYLAKSLFHHELTHASMEYLYNAALKGGEVLDTVMQGIHYIVNKYPFDWDLIMHDLIGDNIFGVLAGENSDFIYYCKGYLAYKDSVVKWKSNNFKKIRPDTTYFFKAKYIDIVDLVRRWKITNALGLMQQNVLLATFQIQMAYILDILNTL